VTLSLSADTIANDNQRSISKGGSEDAFLNDLTRHHHDRAIVRGDTASPCAGGFAGAAAGAWGVLMAKDGLRAGGAAFSPETVAKMEAAGHSISGSSRSNK
jgi:hypothetical protein